MQTGIQVSASGATIQNCSIGCAGEIRPRKKIFDVLIYSQNEEGDLVEEIANYRQLATSRDEALLIAGAISVPEGEDDREYGYRIQVKEVNI